MISALLLFALAAVLTALAVWWIARGFVRAGAPGKRWPVLAAGAAGILVTLGLYLALGRPGLPDAPFAPRLADVEARARTAPLSLRADELLAILDQRSKAAPDDPMPHLFSGDILAGEGRDTEASRAYRQALRRNPDLAPALMGLGRVSVRIDQGVVSPASLDLFRRAAVLAPEDPAPWLYQAMAASQEGRPAEAAPLWREVLKRLPPDDPRRAMAETMIREGAKTPQQPR